MPEPYSIQMDGMARRQFVEFPDDVIDEFLAELHVIAENPDSYLHQPMQSKAIGSMKLRVGDYRLVYQVIHSRRLIRVWRAGHRGRVYKGLGLE